MSLTSDDLRQIKAIMDGAVGDAVEGAVGGLGVELKGDIAQLRDEVGQVREGLDNARIELRGSIAQVRTDLMGSVEGVREELVDSINALRKMLEEDARAESKRLDRVDRRSLGTHRALRRHMSDGTVHVAAGGLA